MSTVKFRKVPELFPNRKVRTVRTEQLWWQVCLCCLSTVIVTVNVTVLFLPRDAL